MHNTAKGQGGTKIYSGTGKFGADASQDAELIVEFRDAVFRDDPRKGMFPEGDQRFQPLEHGHGWKGETAQMMDHPQGLQSVEPAMELPPEL